MRKTILLLTLLAAILCAVPLFASAAYADNIPNIIATGTENATGIYDNKSVSCTLENGTMRISGNGVLQSNDVAAAVTDKGLIKQVEILDGITGIGAEAFRECSSLTDVKIPNSVVSIGEAAFLGCEALKTISIPDSVSVIGERAFVDCISLTEIDLPAALTTIEYAVFGRCSKLKSIELPYGVTSIGEQAFWRCSSLESITIPDSMKSIENYALGEGTNLRSVFIPSSVTNVGEYFIAGWWLGNPMSDIYFGGTENQWNALNAYISEDVNVHFNADKAEEIFVSCVVDGDILVVTGNGNVSIADTAAVVEDRALIKKVIINEGIQKIVQRAFVGYENLVSVSIPESVTEIGFMAFEGCKNLTDISMPNSLTVVGQSAFNGCESLRTLNLPSGLRSIGSYAFYSCDSLRSVYIPETVASIDSSAFDFYYGVLSDVYYGGTELQWKAFNFQYSNDVSIHYKADAAEEIFVEYTVEGNRLTISGNGKVLKKDLDQMVPNKSKIKTVVIQSGITAIGKNSFGYEFENLREIKIPATIKSINDFAIDCRNLTSLTIPEGVTTLEKYAISSSSLERIFIPESITKVDENGLSGCYALKDIYFAGNENQWLALKASGMQVPKSAKVHCNSIW